MTLGMAVWTETHNIDNNWRPRGRGGVRGHRGQGLRGRGSLYWQPHSFATSSH
jgi:hypothetical protein